MHKLISQSSFHLKGTGWYVTDYAKKSGASKGVSTTKNDAAAKSKDASATGSESSTPSQKSNPTT
jgi:predicted nucleic acid-binding Zn ribbon protein